MRIYISSRFDFEMLDEDAQRMSLEEALANPLKSLAVPRPCDDPIGFIEIIREFDIKPEFVSAIEDENTASLFSATLSMSLPASRTSVKLDANSILLVGKYIGPRLPEGAKSLPFGARIEWWTVNYQ